MFGDLSNESKNRPENLHISGINSVRESPILRHSSGETAMIAKSAVVTSSYCTTFNRTVVVPHLKITLLGTCCLTENDTIGEMESSSSRLFF